jgi:solute carrier family 25 protein 38
LLDGLARIAFLAIDGSIRTHKLTIPFPRNVPGVAVYFYLLNEIRYTLSTTGYFAASTTPNPQPSIETFPSPAPASTITTDNPLPELPLVPLPLRIPLLKSAEERRRMTSALPKLNSQGNLVAGAVARTSVGFVLNPFTVLKSRYEVRHPLPTLACLRSNPAAE